MVRKCAPGLLICTLGLLGPLGCSTGGSGSLTSAMFVRSTGNVADVPLEPGAAVVASDVQPPPPPVGDSPKKASVLPSPDGPAPFGDIKPLEALPAQPTTMPADASQADAVPVAVPAPSPAAEPAAAPAPQAVVSVAPHADSKAGQGVYMTVGGVVAIVNETPIYANQILNPLNRELTVKAGEMNENEFRDFAEREIDKEVNELVEDQILFARAYNALNEDDRKLAKIIVERVRQDRITAAGGSVEQARRRSLEDGEDFDDWLNDQYHQYVDDLYRSHHLNPLIQVSADDMRAYYRQNCDKLYADKDKAQFRVIEIDPAVAGGQQAAMEKITALRQRALHGEDFAAMASALNDDSFLKGRGGATSDPGEWMERGSYRNEAVEAAVWKLEPGQITPVVEADQALYIAKLEAKHIGVTKPFDDPTVQQDIYTQLSRRQSTNLEQKMKQDFLEGVTLDARDEQVALDMAMQKYAQLHQKDLP